MADDKIIDKQPDADPKPDPNLEAVKEIAAGFKTALDDMRSTPAPAPEPAKPDTAAIQAQLAADETKMWEDYNALVTEGNAADAAKILLAHQHKINQATAGDPADSPAAVAMIETARRETKRGNEKLFDSYKDEIEAEVAKMDVGKQINAANWDDAVATVKARHFDELMQVEREAILEELKEQQKKEDGTGLPPTAPGSLGRRGARTTTTKLEHGQLLAAEMLGLSDEEMQNAVDEHEKYIIPNGFYAGMVEIVPIPPKS